MEQPDVEQEKVIRKIEEQIDTYFKNLEFFKCDKRTLLIETIDYLQGYIYAFETTRGNDLLSIMIHLRRVINSVNKMIDGILSFSEFNDNKDVNITDLFFECENYNLICDAFIAYSRGLYDAIYDRTENKLFFSFKKTNPFSTRIFVNDEIERMYEKAIAVSNGSKLSEKEIRTIRPKGSPILELNEETFQFVMEQTEPFLDLAVSRHFDTQTQLPTDWDLIGLTMDEYRVGWCAITRATLKKIGEDYLNIFQKKKFVAYSRFKVKDLITLIQDNTLPIEKAERILNLLIYNPELKNNSVMYQPMFFINEDEIIFAPSLFSQFIPQDNFIAVINKINNKLYNQLSNQKEDFLIEELNRVC